jgi:hypothetical protein
MPAHIVPVSRLKRLKNKNIHTLPLNGAGEKTAGNNQLSKTADTTLIINHKISG